MRRAWNRTPLTPITRIPLGHVCRLTALPPRTIWRWAMSEGMPHRCVGNQRRETTLAALSGWLRRRRWVWINARRLPEESIDRLTAIAAGDFEQILEDTTSWEETA